MTIKTITQHFVNTILWSRLSHVKIVLLKNSQIYNIEQVGTQLMICDNGVYHYYIPSTTYNKNVLILGYFDSLKPFSIINSINPEKIETDIYNIMDEFCVNVNWLDEDINNHSLHGADQTFFGNFLDEVNDGGIDNSPQHWGAPFNKQRTIAFLCTYKEYSDFLEKNNFPDTSANILRFYNT